MLERSRNNIADKTRIYLLKKNIGAQKNESKMKTKYRQTAQNTSYL